MAIQKMERLSLPGFVSLSSCIASSFRRDSPVCKRRFGCLVCAGASVHGVTETSGSTRPASATSALCHRLIGPLDRFAPVCGARTGQAAFTVTMAWRAVERSVIFRVHLPAAASCSCLWPALNDVFRCFSIARRLLKPPGNCRPVVLRGHACTIFTAPGSVRPLALPGP